MRITSAVGAVIMPFASLGCIVVDKDFVHTQSQIVKCPLYMFIAAAIIINFTINIINIINSCSWGNIKDRLLSNNDQVKWLIIMNISLGVVLGLTFGLLDVEDSSKTSSKMTVVTIIFAFIGLVSGIIFAYINEKQTQKIQNIGLDPLATSQNNQKYDEM